jgi:hypothetical protein
MFSACSKNGASESDSLVSAMQELAQKCQLEGPPLMELAFQQAWLDAPDADFSPALARVYVDDEDLVLLAVLQDLQIANSADGFNQKTWTTGDVFEIFIEVDPDLYYEFHVTPENQNLFLRWEPDHFRAVRKGEAEFETALIQDPSFLQSTTEINPEGNFWTVCARIPLDRLLAEQANRGQSLRFSLARYDTTAGNPEPVLSATPDLTEANFHDRAPWHTLPEALATPQSE